MASLSSIRKGLVKGLSVLIYQLCGTVSWNRPPWMKKLQARSISDILTIGILCLMGLAAIFLYGQKEDRLLATAQISPPASVRDKLTIDFISGKGTEMGSAAAAPLEQLGKIVEAGIAISPPIMGTWQWQGDNQLTFTPSEDWPAGQTYQIAFDKSVFDRHFKMKRYQNEFLTPPLAIVIEDLRLYQDPIEPQLQKIVGTLKFNFPIDLCSLTASTHLVLQEVKSHGAGISNGTIPLTVTAGKTQQIAYIESAPLKMPASPSFAHLVIKSGVKPSKGSSRSTLAMKQKLLIPDVNSFYRSKMCTLTSSVTNTIIQSKLSRLKRLLE